MKTLYLLHRAREPERVFLSAEALVRAAMGAGEPGEHFGHQDVRQRAIEALKAAPCDEWARLDLSTIAMPFVADPKSLDVAIEN